MIQDYGLIKVKLADLEFDKENPNELTKEQQESLKKSFRKFGNVMPILIDQNNFIVHGNHRAEIYQQLGLEEIPAFRREFKDDDERRLCSQAMNKLHGQYETLKDSNQLLLLFQNQKLDELTELIAQPKEELQRIIQKGHPDMQFYQEDNFDVDKALEELVPQTQLGDIWQLGNHRLICADCSDEKSIKRLMQDKKADMVFTDPPYGVDYGEKNEYLNSIAFANRIEDRIQNDSIEDYYEFYNGFLKTLQMAETNSIYITIAYQQLLSLLKALEDLGFYFSQLLVWVKNNHVLGRTDYRNKHELIVYCWKGKHEYYGGFDTTVWEIDKPLSNRLHPTMKPIELIARAITNSSKPEALVFDAFLGSGSTLIACEQTDRICYGVEIDPHYCDVIVKRWEEFTNRKAKLLREE